MKTRQLIGIVLGALLIACSILYVLSILGIADFSFSLDGWWTLFIILPCLSGLMTSRDKFFSLFGLAVGVLLLLAARGVFNYAKAGTIMVPVIVVLLGAKLIVKSVRSSESKNKVAPVASSKHVTAVFCEQDADYVGEELTVAKVCAVFGGTTCNLRNAEITDQSQIQLSCIFGGADILVPEDVVIRNETLCLFGGISDHRATSTAMDAKRTLFIRGLCLFGGADIK